VFSLGSGSGGTGGSLGGTGKAAMSSEDWAMWQSLVESAKAASGQGKLAAASGDDPSFDFAM
jgi:hypothetical protein